MLTQQNLMDECSEQRSALSGPMLNKIEHESSRIKNLVTQLRISKRKSASESPATPFHLQNECQISNIEPVSQKLQRNSFQLDLPGDLAVKKTATIMPFTLKNKFSDKEIGDKGLKYRPRGSINGRDDIRVKNLNQVHKKIVGSLDKRRGQSNSPQKEENIEMALNKLDQMENPENLYGSFLQSQSRFKITSRKRQSETQRPNKTKDSIVHRGNSQRHEKLMIDPKQLHEYLRTLSSHKFPAQDCSPSKIYQFFITVATNFGIESEFNEPLIKRYRNCIYFGHKVPQYGNYVGFVWYYRRALYYGEFEKGRKNGYGVEIDMEDEANQCIWKGTFCNGKKTGYFQLISNKLQYNGALVNSYFDGEGMLKTKGYSVYKGTFQAGMKHGFGVENFENKKSLCYKGEYSENKFEGKGQLQGPNYYYKGQFRNNKAHGEGFERTDQFQYEGNFKNGKKSGHGTLKLRNGDQFTGIFQNGELVQEASSPSSNQKQSPKTSPAPSIQYEKKIKIQSFKKFQQQSSLSPSTMLAQEPKMQPPSRPRESFLKQQLNSRREEKFNGEFQSRTMPLNNTSNVDVLTYSSRIVPLEKHLSKRLSSLYEENQNEEGTIDQNKYRMEEEDETRGRNLGFFRVHEVQNNERKNKYVAQTRQHLEEQNQNDEEEPLEIKVLSRL